ncbi:MAG TPA: hypothetical protein VE820_10890 [Sphingomicrobium sp.]|jgi:hypothetical protein|nr:hypothetical protein [Sphingomicrobium sp.]
MKRFVLASATIVILGTSMPAVAQSVHQRERLQEQRIRQGERSGTLTPAEARRLQYLEARLHRTEARMRYANGGRLSPWERRRLQRMANEDSAAIYRLKHNYRTY